MEMTLKISGRDVVFKKTGATMLMYKMLFGREYFADLAKVVRGQKKLAAAQRDLDEKAVKKKKKKSDADVDLTEEDLSEVAAQLESLDMDVYYNVLYVLAKAADPSIPDQMTWYSSFDDFDVISVFNAVSPMLSRELGVDAKNSSPAAV